MTAYSYVRFARTVSRLNEDELFIRYLELLDIPATATMTREEAIREAIDVIRRHAATVLRVLEEQGAKYLSQLIAGQIAAASVLGKVMQEQLGRPPVDRRWTVPTFDASPSGPHPDLTLPAKAPVEQAGGPQPTLIWQGNGWHISFRGRDITLKPTVGTERLAKLLREPGRVFRPEELDAPVPETATAESVPDLLLHGFHLETAGQAEPIIDQETVESCNAVIAELEAQRQVAIDRGDPVRAAELAAEIEPIRSYLQSATGLLDQIRDEPEPSRQRYRAVRTSIQRTVDAIHNHHRELGKHLNQSLRFDGTCCYQPEEPTAWTVKLP
jgi:hypothetical protein